MFPQAPASIYQTAKCFVTYGTMGHVDPKQPPSKGKPWNAVLAQDFVHKVDLIVPASAYETMHENLAATCSSPEYFKVIMTLSDVLSGAFFTEYIKKGNILMLSEGKTTVGRLFTLREGVLTMYLDKETYERAGLVGKPYGAKGGRGLKPRWVVSYDLRSPSMLHGKKGFDRLVYASKTVLNKPTSWLFSHVTESTHAPDPLLQFHPTKFTSSPGVSQDIAVLQPPLAVPPEVLADSDRDALEEITTEIYEWLSLIRLGSPRVEPSDNIDPYLSRYRIPGETHGQEVVAKLTWQGFISTQWFRAVLINTLLACPTDTWFSLSATCFSKSISSQSDEVVLLRPCSAAGEFLMWETKGLD